ncbi:MAG: hypothetical protein JJ969_12720 [Rhizobiaceae bacterium]|nr:hypothetical protein [Rhizobiaceae bacterium]
MTDLVLGIDLGSTSVKAAVLDRAGNCLSRFAEAYPTVRPSADRAEQDPALWMRLIGAALAQFAHDSFRGRIGVGGLCSQVNTHVFVDRTGEPLIPAILWQDTRAGAEAAELDARISVEDKIAWLGAPIPIDASHPLARMLWVSRHRPDIWERTAHVLLPKDYCLLKLTGELVTDPVSNVGIVGTDHNYVGPILDLVPGAAERLAPLNKLSGIVGEISGSFGLPGVPMITGTMDGWVGLFGTGASTNGRTVYVSGTSEVLGISSEEVTGEPGIIVFSKAEGLRLHAGPTQSGGASQGWFCELTGMKAAEMAELVAGTPRRNPTPLFLPQLAGERSPLWNAGLRGAFVGIDSSMAMPDFARAVYEGVAFSARHVLGALEASANVVNDPISCGGGGFIPDIWGQIRADVLGRRLQRLAVNEPGIVGAASLAAFAAGGYTSLEEAHACFAQHDQVWEPDLQKRGLYDDLFGLYKEAIAVNEAIGKRLAVP